KGESKIRPSVETSLHNLFESSLIVHTHPTVINALLCSVRAKELTEELFGNEVLFVDYTDPGYVLFKETERQLRKYIDSNGKEPGIVFLQNHGMLICGDDSESVKMHTEKIMTAVNNRFIRKLPSLEFIKPSKGSKLILNKISEYFNSRNLYTAFMNNEMTGLFMSEKDEFSKTAKPFTPDNIVYCKSEYLFAMGKIDDIINSIRSFELRTGYYPRIIGLQRTGLISAGDSIQSAQRSLEVFQDMMKIRFLSENFGGPEFLTGKQVEFIDSWEAENYRRKF
ncbi:MAG TPA: class II aldolase, partial [Bacteroidales bacterium]|nr:class II aldolase [Bacteroidales bacterium]